MKKKNIFFLHSVENEEIKWEDEKIINNNNEKKNKKSIAQPSANSIPKRILHDFICLNGKQEIKNERKSDKKLVF